MDVRVILKRVKANPVAPLLAAIDPKVTHPLVLDDLALCAEAYKFYRFSLERLLNEMSLARRFRNGPYFALKYGVPYTPQEKKLAKRFHETKRFFDLDFANFIIHCRILLDRVISVSRYFLTGKELPSFTSFNQHRRFFQKPEHRPYGKHEAYALYISDNTDWFDTTLKPVRDKFLVHAQSAHMRTLGLEDFGSCEVKMMILTPRGPSDKPFALVGHMTVSVLELVEAIGRFLEFFNAYGRDALRRERKT